MSTTLAEQPLEESQADRRRPVPLVLSWVGLLIALSVVVGGLTALFWVSVVELPSWRILPDGQAVISERAWTEVIAADAWFVVCGALVGLGLGLVTWKWFHPIGWPTALLAAGAGVLAGVVCWQLGELLGPSPFVDRVAVAQPGDLVPISLQLRSVSALAVWGFMAIAPVLLAASLGPEDAPPRPQRRLRFAVPEPVEEVGETVDERGVVTATTTSPESPR